MLVEVKLFLQPPPGVKIVMEDKALGSLGCMSVSKPSVSCSLLLQHSFHNAGS